jgi:hypothetical protein
MLFALHSYLFASIIFASYHIRLLIFASFSYSL